MPTFLIVPTIFLFCTSALSSHSVSRTDYYALYRVLSCTPTAPSLPPGNPALSSLDKFKNIFTTNYDYNLENSLGGTDKVCHLHGEFGKLSSEYNVTSLYYATHKTECDVLISKKIPNMEHIYSDAIMSWSWLEKYGEMIEPDTKNKENLFKSISGQLEIVGLAPANDEHLFLLINTNPKIKSVIYYYLKDEDRIELPYHLKKPVTYKKVTKFWNSMK